MCLLVLEYQNISTPYHATSLHQNFWYFYFSMIILLTYCYSMSIG